MLINQRWSALHYVRRSILQKSCTDQIEFQSRLGKASFPVLSAMSSYPVSSQPHGAYPSQQFTAGGPFGNALVPPVHSQKSIGNMPWATNPPVPPVSLAEKTIYGADAEYEKFMAEMK